MENLKKNWKKNLFYVIFGFLLCFLLCRSCSGNGKQIVYEDKIVYVPKIDTTIVTNTITEWKTDWKTKNVKIHDTVYRDIIREISDQDLVKIAVSYYNKNFYGDTIYIDTIGYVIINDTIQKNEISNRTLAYNITMPQAIKLEPKGFLSAGVLMGGNKQSFDLGVGLSWTTKKRFEFGYQYNFIDNSHYLLLSKSIFKRRK